MEGLIGKKIGMTRVFTDNGQHIPVTVIKAGPCPIVQVKKKKTDGYDALQLAFEPVKKKKVTKPLLGHFQKAKLSPHRHLAEFRLESTSKHKPGDVLTVEIFSEKDKITCTGITKGKGFQGGVRRHKFKGGPKTHGQSNKYRSPGSIGSSSFPSRVLKGIKMAGHMGSKKQTIKNLEVVKVIPEDSLLLVKGAVPGAKGSYVLVQRSR